MLITTVLTLKAFGSWERSQQPFPLEAILGCRDDSGATDAFCSCRGLQLGFFQQPHLWLRTTVVESAHYSCRGPDPRGPRDPRDPTPTPRLHRSSHSYLFLKHEVGVLYCIFFNRCVDILEHTEQIIFRIVRKLSSKYFRTIFMHMYLNG